MTARGWRLGAHWYGLLDDLGSLPNQAGCALALVRREGDGPRSLLQVWEPHPGSRALDAIREDFLQRFSQAGAMDPGACHMGFDDDKIWFAQELGGTPLLRLWAGTGAGGRAELKAGLLQALAQSRVPRCLAPEVIGVKPGRFLVPRLLAADPWEPRNLVALLDAVALPEAPGVTVEDAAEGDPASGEEAAADAFRPGARPWAAAPDLADASMVPIRGRGQELTYLKSLMLGVGGAMAMERVLVLEGETGLGHERLCDWAAAAAESEGLWVTSLDVHPGEKAGGFLGRLVQEIIAGAEAELYAASPAVARGLARRIATFAFLRGGRRADFAERKVDPEELDAALGALAFAQDRHPRLLQIRGLERADAAVHEVLAELVLASNLPWVLSSRGPGQVVPSQSCLAPLRENAAAAHVVLDRLEDRHLREVLGDLLGPQALPEAYAAEMCRACLGNPGLLQGILEMAQVRGALLWQEGRWVCAPGPLPPVEVQADQVHAIFAGRLRRVPAAALALVRLLALADQPVPLATLGRALGLDADGAEEAARAAASAKLVLAVEAGLRLSSPLVRELAMAKLPPGEGVRCARALLQAMAARGGKPGLSVRLQAFAQDPASALAQVLAAIQNERPGPLEAERIVQEALALGPDAGQRARLWEFLADCWCLATEGDRLPAAASPDEAAWEALDRALSALAGAEGTARLLRKRAWLELRLRRLDAARATLHEAALGLADHPFHPEQPYLRLGMGRLFILEGFGGRGMAMLEEGLQLAAQFPEGQQAQVDLLVELGRAQGERGQFQRALDTLEQARRLLEHQGDRRRLVEALHALGSVHLGLGQMDTALACLKEALELALLLDDVALLGLSHLQLGMVRSHQQLAALALAHLDSATRRFDALGEPVPAALAQMWKARTLGAVGDPVLADLVLARVASLAPGTLTPMELAEQAFLDGELAGFRGSWDEAARRFRAAANRFEEAGFLWREQLARLRCLQAESMEAPGAALRKSSWIRLEQLKGPVEATGSRWLDLEWHRAHALLLVYTREEEAAVATALQAWGEVLSGARALGFPALVLEASARSARLLLDRGERLGARSRMQDALPSLDLLWSRVPETFSATFLARADLVAFRKTAEAAGLSFTLPERRDPLADWSPTRANLPPVPALQGTP